MHAFVVLGLIFSIPSQEIGLGNFSKMTYFVLSGSKTLTQSINQFRFGTNDRRKPRKNWLTAVRLKNSSGNGDGSNIVSEMPFMSATGNASLHTVPDMLLM